MGARWTGAGNEYDGHGATSSRSCQPRSLVDHRVRAPRPGPKLWHRRRTRQGARHPRRRCLLFARHRSRRDHRVARVLRRPAGAVGSGACAVPDAALAGALRRTARRHPGADVDGLRQHDSDRAGAVVPGRRGRRAALPRLDPVERGHHGAPCAAAGSRCGRPYFDVRVLGCALRGRVQPLLPRQGASRRRRPDLHPGSRLSRHLCARLPRGPANRGQARRIPPGALASRRRHPVLPAPAADARLLGVPHGVDGAGPDERHLSGPVQPLPGTTAASRTPPISTSGHSSATARWTSRRVAGWRTSPHWRAWTT